MDASRERVSAGAFTLVELVTVVAVLGLCAAVAGAGLFAAREKANRASCQANLRQMGLAMTSYMADYSGYVPSWPAWSAASCAEDWQLWRAAQEGDAGVVIDHRDRGRVLRQTLSSGALGGENPAKECYTGQPRTTWWWGDGAELAMGYGLRVIAKGQIESGGGDFGPGQLNTLPRGLGMLLWSGYLGDARTFFCPSAADMQAELIRADSDERQGGVSSLDAMRQIGGFDAQSFLRGDYRNVAPFYPAPKVSGGFDRGVISSYNYRNQELFGAYMPEGDQHGNLRMPHTRARVPTQKGCPAFKTARILGGRAVATDTFSRSGAEMNLGLPGRGIEAHRDGYNVLYGDGRVAWFGDPQQRIIWQGDAASDGRSLATAAWHGTWSSIHGAEDPERRWRETSHYVFHEFDAHCGIDLGTPFGE